MRDPARQDTTQNDAILAGVAAAALGVVVAAAVATWCAAAVTGHGHGSPIGWIKALVDGQTGWSTAATVVLILEAVAIVAAAGYGGWRWWQWDKSRARIDRKAKYMSTRRDIAPYAQRAATKDAERLGLTTPGLPLGKSIVGRAVMYSLWEWSMACVVGTRGGKTSCLAVPRILAAPGPVVATSVRPDLVYDTKVGREMIGTAWTLDLQGIVREKVQPGLPDGGSDWYWPILSDVTSYSRSEELVDVLSAAVMSADARTDAYFNSASRALLAGLQLAAALEGLEYTQVYAWTADPGLSGDHESPFEVLTRHGYGLVATDIQAKMDLTSKQRDGVYAGAQEWISFMKSPEIARWVVSDGPGERRRRFDAAAFVRSTDTLYLLSKGQGGSGGRAIVGALTQSVMRAGEEVAALQGGRLQVPLVLELDEAANVCRIPGLPDKFTFYGGLGIIISTYFQNPAQPEECWGVNGWRQILSSCNALLIGRGIRDEKFLPAIVEMIGARHFMQKSRSRGRGGATTSDSPHSEQIVPVSELVSLDTGRCILHVSGAKPIVVAMQHWSTDPDLNEKVTTSRAVYMPDREKPASEGERPVAWVPAKESA